MVPWRGDDEAGKEVRGGEREPLTTSAGAEANECVVHGRSSVCWQDCLHLRTAVVQLAAC